MAPTIFVIFLFIFAGVGTYYTIRNIRNTLAARNEMEHRYRELLAQAPVSQPVNPSAVRFDSLPYQEGSYVPDPTGEVID